MQAKNYLDKSDPYYDAKTERMWNHENRIINKDATGKEFWCNQWYQQSAIYFKPEDTHEASEIELATLQENRREKQKKYKKNTEIRKEKNIREDEKIKWKEQIEKQDSCNRFVIEKMVKYIADNCKKMSEKSCQTIILDVETTGLDSKNDELLQVSILNLNYEILLNTYVKPYIKSSGKAAQLVNGIEAPYLHEIIAEIKGIFESAETIIGYNVSFDLSFFTFLNIDFEKKKIVDVMLDFAPYYGEYNTYYRNFKWKNLETCAAYFGYRFKAHDSLEDTKATLHCYKKLKELKEVGDYDERVTKNCEQIVEANKQY